MSPEPEEHMTRRVETLADGRVIIYYTFTPPSPQKEAK